MTEVSFLSNELVQDAVVRNFEIIGEAARNIERYHAAFSVAHATVPWNDLYTMRNRIAHGYFSIDWGIVWKTIERDLLPLALAITELLEALE